jgi:NTE family protein
MTPSFQQALLDRHLSALLGDLEPDAAALLRDRLEWVTVVGGQTVMQQDGPGDAMYLVVSGRLRAHQRGDDGVERVLREMGRGQVLGELSLFTGAPRSATIVAVRDSVLVRLHKPAFDALMASSPRLSAMMTRQIIHRLQDAQPFTSATRPSVVAVVGITDQVDLHGFAAALQTQLQRLGRVAVVDAARIDQDLRQTGLARSAPGQLEADRALGLYLDELEATHDFVLLLADDSPTHWTHRCSRRSDLTLLVADATQPPDLHPIEQACLRHEHARTDVAELLVLLHPADRRSPQGTRRWLQERRVSDHVHVRPALDRDVARLARLLSGTAVGLVLAGGGARGFAHLGVYRALQERGIEVDWVGGTSIGSVMASLMACDRPLDEVMTVARRAFSVNPTGDFNLLPMISLIAGRRLRRIVGDAELALTGQQGDVEDLWKNCFCVASNYTQAREQVLHRGPLVPALLASIAIPGALPPVLLDGDLLCDGGTFNNFPVDVMRRMRGVGTVYGVDLSFRQPQRLDMTEVPGAWALLRDRFRPRSKRRYRLPSLVTYLMNVTILYSTSRQRQSQQLADLCFSPPLRRVGMLEWSKFDDIVAQGHAHACEVLDARSRPTAPTQQAADDPARPVLAA